MRHREQERLQLSQEHDPMSSMSSSATTSITPHSIQVPSEIVRKWQEVVDVLAEIMHVPSASIMRVEPPHIKVFVSSTSKGNPCEPGALDTGPYCETVLKTGQTLLIPNDVENEAWNANRHVRLVMISYLGVPIGWPDGRIFGTICVRDNKRNEYSEAYLKLLLHFRDMLQADLKSLARLHGEIEQREAKIRRLVDGNIIGVFVWDVEGRILEANDAFLRLIGYDREDVVAGRLRWTDLTPPEWLDRDERRWLPELKVTGSLQPFEKEYFRKDGSRVPVLIGVASFEEDGNQGVAFVLDLTERKCAEQAAEQLASIVESSDDAIVSKDLNGIIRTWNRGAERLFGYKAAEVIGRPITILIPPDRLDEEPGILARIRCGEPVDHYETVRRHKDGSLIDISLTVSPTRDATGAIVGASKIARDITERKRAEQALRQSTEALRRSEAYLAEAQRLSHTGTWVSDGTLTTVYNSEENYRIWGVDPLQGLPSRDAMWQRIHPDDRGRVWERVQEAVRQKRDYAGEFRIVLP